MSRSLVTGIVAVALTALGFVAGGAGDAWRWRDSRVEPWRKMVVEHEGVRGASTRTRVIFQNPELPLQAIEVHRDADEKPELARATLRDGTELTLRYDDEGRPTGLDAADGTRAELAYGASGTRVTLFGADGKEAGAKVVHPSLGLRAPLELASVAPDGADETDGRTATERLVDAVIGTARADENGEAAAESETITVRRNVSVRLAVALPAGKDVGPGEARLEASCAPLTCLAATPEVATPSDGTIRVEVSDTVARSKLGAAPDAAALEPFVAIAKNERKEARRALPDVGKVVAAVGITSLGCRALGAEAGVCVKGLGKTGAIAGAAIASVAAHTVATDASVVDPRARALYFEDRARASLDRPMHLELCLSREKYARTCTTVDGSPFAAEPMAPVARAVDLKKRIGATLVGKFVVTQQDGPDCKFSPSPRTSGPLQLGIDSERGTVTASFRADDRGTRADQRCSLGTANMSWSQTYAVTASQAFTAQQLQAGGKLPVHLTGSMTGSGTFSFSNCRTSGGSSAACPGGKSEPYSYPVDLLGEVDLDTGKGGGNIIVRNAPLSTSGTWTTEGEK